MTNLPLESILEEYKALGINQQIDYSKFYLYSIITHSTAIEGSTITEIENQMLFDEGIGINKSLKEQFMNLDLKAAYDKAFEYAQKHVPITKELLCNLSALVMKNTGSEFNKITGTFNSANGELRLCPVSAGRGGKTYMSWEKVPQKLDEFCKWVNQERNKFNSYSETEKYLFSFQVHYNLATIHPWVDGNGRMSRLVMNMVQYEAGLIPSIVKKENRLEYINSLSISQETENNSSFLKFMLEHHKDNLLEQISDYKNSLEKDNLKDFNIDNGFEY